ncbi:Hsp20 family protein [Streptomyces sp. NPDC048417]|uniref:Hsp20/alpha crystallin family protein n=1 Tax=Streptomyces sp. NPDC048417 TaxID=3155387 RepID=UPI00341C9A66
MVTEEIKERERKGVLRRSTRRVGAFEYPLRLPGELDTRKIKADMQDGVLSLTVPKADVAKPRHVEISETRESTESPAGMTQETAGPYSEGMRNSNSGRSHGTAGGFANAVPVRTAPTRW